MEQDKTMLVFEQLTAGWEFDYTPSERGGYEDSNTGIMYGMFKLGYEAQADK